MSINTAIPSSCNYPANFYFQKFDCPNSPLIPWKKNGISSNAHNSKTFKRQIPTPATEIIYMKLSTQREETTKMHSTIFWPNTCDYCSLKM
jgi:hypothetical protein